MKLIAADWSAPENIHAVTTTRQGGHSLGPYAGLNLGDHVDDFPASVIKNRRQLVQELDLIKQPQWLSQVHGTEVIKASDDGKVIQADACWSDAAGQPCIVMTADCLPVFFTDQQGSRVAVAHAGWRGLVDGVLEQTLSVFPDPSKVIVWMGPAIGQPAFEVGGEVRERFCDLHDTSAEAFAPSANPGKWLADIYMLARLRLNRRGVSQVSGGNYCTFTQSELFYSYRRDGITGRMASVIWID
ncbi:peptidoglycan editing factor PgeF [Amphritea japonica]|uniref:Purine nucleoside phosphorylase n=1 Tax=Amphritea japonica ATCC BAA-1530 TaxID=1278309 RepID=A0A7R6PQL6_9GAMM|nr:peptidoglycan editing factor PgeF [Amphritea japonica]BBB27718.1 multi-copper polyphenol oxidoreductase [Amphritea japonica ATCC BAA-1530]